MAEVFLGVQEGAAGFSREVAIKLVRPDDDDEELLEGLAIEAQLAAQLAHPNIVQVIDFGRHDSGFYLVMEYLNGWPLDRVMSAARKAGTRPPLEVVVDIGLQVLDALSFAHVATDSAGSQLQVIHRDIKPANIMVLPIGLAKVVDFGIARAASIERRTATGMVKGTPAYMAPEQLEGAEVGPAADLYAVAVALFELAAGRVLFTGESFMHLIRRRMEGFRPEDVTELSEIYPALTPIVERGLAADPAERWPDADSMAAALRELVSITPREPLRLWLTELGFVEEHSKPPHEDPETVALKGSDYERARASRVGTQTLDAQVPPTRAQEPWDSSQEAVGSNTRLRPLRKVSSQGSSAEPETAAALAEVRGSRGRVWGVVVVALLLLVFAATRFNLSEEPPVEGVAAPEAAVPPAPTSVPTQDDGAADSAAEEPEATSSAPETPGVKETVRKTTVSSERAPAPKVKKEEQIKKNTQDKPAAVPATDSPPAEATGGTGELIVSLQGRGGYYQVKGEAVREAGKTQGNIPAGTRTVFLMDKNRNRWGTVQVDIRAGHTARCVWKWNGSAYERREHASCRVR